VKVDIGDPVRTGPFKPEKDQVGAACKLEDRESDDTRCDPSNSKQTVCKVD